MDQYLFENVDGFPMPRLPFSTGGAVTADGEKYFGLAQAAARFAGFTEDRLRDMWSNVFPWAGIRATRALTIPDVLSAPLSVVEGWKVAMRYSRVTKYRHFSDEQFAEFLGRAAALKLNPVSGQVYGALRPDPETRMPSVALIVGISGFRMIAQRTGERAGTEPVRFEKGNRFTTFEAKDLADPTGRRMTKQSRPIPESATATIYRRGPTGDIPYTVTVNWDDCYPAHAAPSLWDERPEACLSRAAMAAVYREAYPETGTCYVREEMIGANPGGNGPDGAGGGPVPVGATDDGASDHAVQDEEEPPTSWHQLELRLIDLGFKDPQHRKRIVATIRAEWNTQDASPMFYTNAFNAIRRDPRRFQEDAA